MSKANKMLEALAKMPHLRVVEDPGTLIGGGATMRFDGWSNDVTGQGTSRDKTAYNYFSPGRVLTDGEISGLYHDNDVAARMVDIVPDEMLREGFTVDVGDAKANTELADLFDALGLDDKIADAIRWGRAYGGGALLLGADDGRSAATPLMPERAKALSYVYVLDRRYLWPLTYYTEPGHQKLGQAETYMVTSPSFAAQAPVSVVHETRLVLFGGATTGIRERETNAGWDLSILQRATKVLSDFDLGWGAVALLLADGNQSVFKISGLAEAITQQAAGGTAGGAESFLRERLKLLDMGRSVVRAMVLDAGGGEDEPEESFERQVFPMTGIPETLEKLMVRLAVTADVPCTRLFGISPAGLNATGESDVRGWYDRLRSGQTRKVAPKIRRIVRVALQTKTVDLGTPSAIKVSFPSLWSESPSQAALTRKTQLEGDKVAIDAGMLLPERAGLSRFRPDGFAQEIQLSPEEAKAFESALSDEVAPDDESTAEGEDIQKTAMNGSQVASLVDIVAQVASGTIPRDSGVQALALSFQISTKEAEKLLGTAGTPKFEPTKPEPTGFGGFGGGPPKPLAPAKPVAADLTTEEQEP
jgi:phage-related protein (TIGR01555 family)